MLARLFAFLFVASTILAAQPNVVFIISDDQGYPDLGCMGSKPLITPNLDKRAYGRRDIGPNEALIFDVELFKVK